MLNDTKIRAAKPRDRPYRLGDSAQLYLFVAPARGKLWRMNYSFGRNVAGKPMQKTLSFGAYPAVSLADARGKRDEAKRLLAQKQDPAVAFREADTAKAAAAEQTFRLVAEMWFEHSSGWSLARLAEWAAANEGRWHKRDALHWTADVGARWSTVYMVHSLCCRCAEKL